MSELASIRSDAPTGLAPVADGHPSLTVPAPGVSPPESPIPVLRALAALWRKVGLYPEGHPVVSEAVGELLRRLESCLQERDVFRIDIIQEDAHVDGYSFRAESHANAELIREFTGLGVDSVHVRRGVDRDELYALGMLIAEMAEGDVGPVGERAARRGIRNVSLGRLVPLDTRWHYYEWPDAPGRVTDTAYAESLVRAEDAFGAIEAGEGADLEALRDLLQLLVSKVATSNAALGQILAVKQYENHTYCHSVNVAILSLLLGRRLGLSEGTIAGLAEAALLHDVGKVRIPVDVLKKPGPLDKREWALIRRHPKYGAEVLMEVSGLSSLTPTVALEHHRNVGGGGYPELDEGEPIHLMSQLVAVADTYEALTGARSYREPALPEQACLILAQMAGEKLHPALVRCFVSAITFFPVGSVVRTSRDEVGVVVETSERDPLHPVISVIRSGPGGAPPGSRVDTRERDASGPYVRHILETVRPLPEMEIEGHLQVEETPGRA